MKHCAILFFHFFCLSAFSSNYWQQKVEYEMEVDFDDQMHQYSGMQKLTYFNNSPDTLFRLYYHLYLNAFQPGSMMDVRSRTIEDPDSRVEDRISTLKEEEIGYLKVKSLSSNGRSLAFLEEGTILSVHLDKPLLPGKKLKLQMEFAGQVPVQIRRSGRYNAEGIAYSMTQWYPKICAYDQFGWHATAYVGREFHGVFGSFDVTIRIDSAFTLAATGILQNPQDIGHGYQKANSKAELSMKAKLAWHFKAENVHDFAWAADKNYVHIIKKVPNGPEVHFFYKNEPELQNNWQKLMDYTVQTFEIAADMIGPYAWSKYSVVQGGDGGMEYPMLTLVNGQKTLGSLVGTTVHEIMHSWFQAAIATDEALYPWMDEGFTQYSASRIMTRIFNPSEDERVGNYYLSYLSLAASGKEEPMATMADHFQTNYAYSSASYGKGAVFVAQLGYICGDKVLNQALRRYYINWKFKQPTPNDFIREMEAASGMNLHWYLNYMLNTTQKIDYTLHVVEALTQENIRITLKRTGQFPMPVDLDITLRDGTSKTINIPLQMMLESKKPETENFTTSKPWAWTNPEYILELNEDISNIAKIEIDRSQRMADIDRSDNVLEISGDARFIFQN